ncbi:MAG: hypothetical protein ACR2KV_07475 [Solirubrobacteraceae bacterium]
MSEPDDPPPGGVLAGLPTTRPQRRSPKRAGRPAGDETPPPTKPRPRAKPRSKPKPKPPAAGRTEAVATQGFEADNARGAVEPPTRADLLGSVAEGAGELAHVGLAIGRHILRSVIGRLPGG